MSAHTQNHQMISGGVVKNSQVQIFGWFALGVTLIAVGVTITDAGAAWQFVLIPYACGLWCMARAIAQQIALDVERFGWIERETRITRDYNLLMVQQLGKLTPRQAELISERIVTFSTPGSDDYYLLPGAMPGRDKIRRETLAEFLRRSTPEYCAPIREFSEGNARDEVNALMSWLVLEGHIAAPAAGNRAAAWKPGAYFVIKQQFGGG